MLGSKEVLADSSARMQKSIACHNGGSEEGPRVKRPPHFFGRNAQFDHAESKAAIGFGDMGTKQPQFFAHLAPNGRVIAQLGLPCRHALR